MIKANQGKILQYICKTEDVHSYDELLDLMKKNGIKLTREQLVALCTEQKIKKQLNDAGEYVYRVVPNTVKNYREFQHTTSLNEMITRADVSGTIVAVHTQDACASTVAAILDGLRDPDILATVAGYNAIMVMTPDTEAAKRVAEKTRSLVF